MIGTGSLLTSAVSASLAVWLLVARPSPSARVGAAPAALPTLAREKPLQTRTAVGLGACVAVLLLVLTGVWWSALLALPVPWLLQKWLPRRDVARERQVVAQAPVLLDLLAACVAAGLPLRRAVVVVAAASPGAFADVLEGIAMAVGVGTDEAQAWRDHAGDRVVGPLARDVARAVGSGAALAAVLQRHREEIASAHRDEVTERARAVGVRSVLPLMCCFLPAFIALGVIPVVASVGARILG